LRVAAGAAHAVSVKTYKQYCPIARGAEIFAERWTPLIIRNLALGCRTFNEILEGAPGMPRALLSQRLDRLTEIGVLARTRPPGGRGNVYELTPCGHDLVDVCFALGRWGARWLEVAPEHLDPHIMLWAMARTAARAGVPSKRVAIRFDLTDLKEKNRFWVVLDRADTEVCLKNPGGHEDVVVTTDSESLMQWHTGSLGWEEARRRGLIVAEGPARLIKSMGTWGLSPFAEVEKAYPA
jgi:DNA-binding HxlR family transcriptional regulator